LTPTRVTCSYSRMIIYCIVLVSIITLFNSAISRVSSQSFATATITTTNIQTYYTVGYSTANVSVTVYTVQFTTTTQMVTNLIEQFASTTSFVARSQAVQPTAASALHSTSVSSDPTINTDPPSHVVNVSAIVFLLACFTIIPVSTLLMFKEKSSSPRSR
jgi:hypothetical protein